MIRKLYTFFQKETVLSISVILAVFFDVLDKTGPHLYFLY